MSSFGMLLESDHCGIEITPLGCSGVNLPVLESDHCGIEIEKQLLILIKSFC